ncbi:MAG: glycoside hydrolase family 88 protein [Oscillospiraceae bacterium]|nr:glycoside hydrolase family 88 protein [Oscillospiraceae bacterium]
MFSKEDKAFASEFLDRVVKKVTAMAPEIGANFPTTNSRIGEWDPKGTTANISSWTTAFWPGMMWLMYLKTGDKMFREYAEGCEAKLDEAFDIFTGIHHDVGFMWSLSAVADYKITGNEKSKARAMHAATVLAGRFNHVAKYIRAWDHSSHRWAIIDCMMNIPLLSFATSIQDDPRFEQVARAHADTVAKSFIRGDGSSNHVVEFDPETGDVLATPRGQGYESGSSWSRGQAWALYGFALAYLNLGKQEYLDTAKKVAHYFIANIEDGKLPLVDFRAPEEPVYYDSSAASIAACGLIEISRAVPEYEAKIYERAAMKLLRVLDENCNYDPKELRLLENASSAYHTPNGMHMPWIFGDYYLLEALMKLDGNDGRFTVHK